MEVEKRKKAQARAEAEKELEKRALLETDETKSKERLARDLEDREKGLLVEGAEILKDYRVSDMKILDSYAPMYEFEE